MRTSIRLKLVSGISLFIIIIFSIAAYLFIGERKQDIADMIYFSTLKFAQLTAPDIAYFHDLYLDQGGFVYFNRELQALMSGNCDVASIAIVSYEGEILFDSAMDVDKKYEGALREVASEVLAQQVQSRNYSVRVADYGVYYFKTMENGEIITVDREEKKIEDLPSGSLFEYFVMPASDKYAIVYYPDYTFLEERVAFVVQRIIYLAVFGIMLGIILSLLFAFSLTRPIFQLVKGVNKISSGDLDARVYIKTRDEFAFLGDAFNKMGRDIKASIEAREYSARVMQELMLAKEIQAELIPKRLPQIPGLDLSAALIPAEEIGGDIYDFLPPQDGNFLFYLGDVTGHGVPAGLISAISSALFFGLSQVHDLKQIVVDVNKVLKVKTKPNMFITLCLMHYIANINKFTFVSAGHEQIIHYRALSNDVILEPHSGVALGMIPDISPMIRPMEVVLESGDFLVIYSDGIPEAWKSGTECYGMERFLSVVQANGKAQSALQMRNAILSDLKNFTGKYKQMDDITVIVIKKL